MRSRISSSLVLSLLLTGCLVVPAPPVSQPSVAPAVLKKAPSTAPTHGTASPSAPLTVPAALAGRVLAPANIIASDGANIIASDGANVIASDGANIIASDGANVISTGGGNYRMVLQAKETRISGARVRLLDSTGQPILVDGQPIETVSTDQGTYSFAQTLPGQAFAVQVEFKIRNGKTVLLRTIARAGQTADVDAATTLVAVGVAEGKGGGLAGIALDKYATAVETARRNLPASLPDWTDLAKVVAAYHELETRVGLLEQRVTKVEQQVNALEEKVGALLGWVYKPVAGGAQGSELGDVKKPDGSYTNMFNAPLGIAAHDGYLYVCDQGNDRIVRLKDGKAERWPAEAIVGPRALAFDAAGNMYVVAAPKSATEVAPHHVVVVTPAGEVRVFAGGAEPGHVDGAGAAARLNLPSGIAVDKAGNLFVADAYNHCIRKITPEGVVSTFAGAPDRAPSRGNENVGDRVEVKDGAGDQASFFSPHGLAFDSAGNLFVAENGTDRIRKITPAGFVTTVAGGTRGQVIDGYETTAQFWGPNQIAINRNDIMYVTDHANSHVRRIQPDGRVTTINATVDSIGNSRNYLVGIAFAADGTMYLSKNNGHVVQALVPEAK